MEYVKIQIAGITQEVPKSDVPQYLRAGYSVVVNASEPVVTPVPPVVPPQDPPVEPAPKTGKKN